MKVGDEAIFQTVLVDDYRMWNLPSRKEFDLIKTFLGTTVTITYIQKHYSDSGEVEYYLDVEFANGFIFKGINSLCFDVLDFEYI